MNAQEFAVWLQGYFEMSGATTLGEKQVQILKDHLALVFEKKTPEYWKDLLRQQQTGVLTGPICSTLGQPHELIVSKEVQLDLAVPVSC